MTVPDREALLREAVAEHGRDVFNVALRAAGNRADAEDATQEAFAALAGAWERLRDPRAVKVWLIRTAVRACWREASRARQRRKREEEVASMRAQHTEELPVQAVSRALGRLPEDLRLPLTLYYLNGLNYAEVAEVVDCPVGSVSARLREGLDALRKSLPAGLAVLAAARLEEALGAVPLEPMPASLTASLEAPLSGAASSSASILGGMAMAAKGKAAVLVGAGLLGILGISFWRHTDRKPEPSSAVPPAAGRTPAPSLSPVFSSRVSEAVRTEPVQPAPEPAGIQTWSRDQALALLGDLIRCVRADHVGRQALLARARQAGEAALPQLRSIAKEEAGQRSDREFGMGAWGAPDWALVLLGELGDQASVPLMVSRSRESTAALHALGAVGGDESWGAIVALPGALTAPDPLHESVRFRETCAFLWEALARAGAGKGRDLAFLTPMLRGEDLLQSNLASSLLAQLDPETLLREFPALAKTLPALSSGTFDTARDGLIQNLLGSPAVRERPEAFRQALTLAGMPDDQAFRESSGSPVGTGILWVGRAGIFVRAGQQDPFGRTPSPAETETSARYLFPEAAEKAQAQGRDPWDAAGLGRIPKSAQGLREALVSDPEVWELVRSDVGVDALSRHLDLDELAGLGRDAQVLLEPLADRDVAADTLRESAAMALGFRAAREGLDLPAFVARIRDVPELSGSYHYAISHYAEARGPVTPEEAGALLEWDPAFRNLLFDQMYVQGEYRLPLAAFERMRPSLEERIWYARIVRFCNRDWARGALDPLRGRENSIPDAVARYALLYCLAELGRVEDRAVFEGLLREFPEEARKGNLQAVWDKNHPELALARKGEASQTVALGDEDARFQAEFLPASQEAEAREADAVLMLGLDGKDWTPAMRDAGLQGLSLPLRKESALQDLAAAAAWLRGLKEKAPRRIHLMAAGEACRELLRFGAKDVGIASGILLFPSGDLGGLWKDWPEDKPLHIVALESDREGAEACRKAALDAKREVGLDWVPDEAGFPVKALEILDGKHP